MASYHEFYQTLLDRALTHSLPREEYDAACSNADWFFYLSDQPLSNFHMECLKKAADANPEFQTIYNRESAKRFNTPHFFPADGSLGHYQPPFPNAPCPLSP